MWPDQVWWLWYRMIQWSSDIYANQISFTNTPPPPPQRASHYPEFLSLDIADHRYNEQGFKWKQYLFWTCFCTISQLQLNLNSNIFY